MRKLVVIFCLIFCFAASYSQNTENNISLKFDNASIIEAIDLIESNSSYHFFFIESWLDSQKRYTKEFDKSSIETVLDFLFSETTINYYVFDKNTVILTKNNKIHDSRIQAFTKIDTANVDTTIVTRPILISKEEVIESGKIPTVRIGKEVTGNKPNTIKLSGFVRNRVNSKPISNLVLLVRDKNIYATTDEKGYYAIELPYGAHIIETILTGIQKTKVRVIMYGDGRYNFNLLETAEQLDEIVIKNNAKDNIKNVVTGLVQIKPESVKIVPQVLGERDLLKIAITLPGINNAGEGADGVNVRGGKADQNLFLIDNSTLYNPNHFLGLFSAVNPFTTQDIKIYKGSIPSQFGGRISSVFDIISKESKTTEFSGEASVGPVTSNLSVDIPVVKEKAGLILAARSTYSNWILRAVSNETLNNSSASFLDVNVKYTHKLDDKNSLRVSGYYSNDDFSIASDTTNAYSNRIFALNWKYKINEKSSGNLLLSHSGYSFSIGFDAEEGIKNFDIEYDINEIELALRMKYLYSKEHKFNYGVASKLYNVNPGSIDPSGSNSLITPFRVQKERALESAIYIEDNYTPNEKLSFNLGARYSIFSALGPSNQRLYAADLPKNETTVIGEVSYNKNEVIKTYNGLSLRFSGRYFLEEDLALKASFNNSFQFIHRLTNNTTASPTDTWKLSDAHIKPQEALQGSLGLYKNINGNDYEISLEGYYKSFQNILDYKTGANLLLNEFIETQVLQGPGKSYGVEFLVRKNTGDFNGWLSYSYSRSFLKLDSEFLEEQVSNGNFFPTNFDKPHDLSVIVNYKLTKRFSFSGNFAYQTGRPITYPIGKYFLNGAEFLLYSERNKFRVPDYYRLDIGFNVEGNHKKNKIGHSFWNISVYNILGRNNPYSIFFVTENGTVKALQSSIFSRPIPTITYNFKF